MASTTTPGHVHPPLSTLDIRTIPKGWVARPRLDRMLTLASQGPVTLVTGGPGSGKTVLLRSWAQQEPKGAVAWLGLDVTDNDRGAFRRHLGEVGNAIDPRLGELLLDLFDEQHTARRSSPAFDALHGIQRAVIVVDDLHAVVNREVLDFMAHLAHNLPANLHLIASSRHRPKFLYREPWALGELHEIEEQAIAFTPDEARALLTSVNTHSVTADEASALVERTDGWATGLRLAALLFPDCASTSTLVARLTGDAGLVADYFAHEVLADATADVTRFMVETSVLDVMTASSCVAVTGRLDGKALLDLLADQHIFVTKLDTAEPTYRYNTLFREFLRSRLQRDRGFAGADPHLKAAIWFASRGDTRAAIHHLVAHGAYDKAFELGVSSVIEKLNDSLPLVDLGQALAEVPQDYIRQDPFRLCVLAADLLADRRLAEAAMCLRAVELAGGSNCHDELLRSDVELLWSVRDGLLCDPQGVLLHHRLAMELLTVGYSRRPPSPIENTSPGWIEALNSVLRIKAQNLAIAAEAWIGGSQVADPALSDDRAPKLSSNPQVPSAMARLAYKAGRLEEALQLAKAAFEDASEKGRTSSVFALDSLVTQATVLYERDQLATARECLMMAQQLCGDQNQEHWHVAIGCEMVRTMIAQGNAFAAFECLRELREIELGDPLPVHLRRRLDGIEVRFRLSLGDLAGAIRILALGSEELRTVEMNARFDLSAGRPDRAAARLVGTIDQAPTPRIEIERLVLLARALRQLGSDHRAESALARAVDRGRTERFIRIFLDDAPELISLLKGAAHKDSDVYIQEILARATTGSKTSQATNYVEVLEPLSGRERELLSYLSSHWSQPEIAAQMYISVNTVKTHAKAVYRKLGAASRSEAVAIAHARGLI
jgi:LuxR family transcriptional regulator, maltose regulon positive regulatory protein